MRATYFPNGTAPFSDFLRYVFVSEERRGFGLKRRRRRRRSRSRRVTTEVRGGQFAFNVIHRQQIVLEVG
jgi:hypothetical protein